MSRRPVVLMDVDGPLTTGAADGMCEVLRAWGYDHARTENITQWDIAKAFNVSAAAKDAMGRAMRAAGVAESFVPRAGSRVFLDELRGWARVIAVTAPLTNSVHWAGERAIWLSEQLGFAARDVVQADDKSLVEGDFLVDDKLDNLVEWSAAHPRGEGVLWNMSYNALAQWSPRASSFEELAGLLARVRGGVR